MDGPGSWHISFTEGKRYWFAWGTETEPPRNATARSMMFFPGEVHFATGRTLEEARDKLEADLPPRTIRP